jgi:DNA-dependent RNA polymerase
MLTIDQEALEEAAVMLRKHIGSFLAVPRTKQQIPADWSPTQREEFLTNKAAQSSLPRKQQDPRQIPLRPAERMEPLTDQRARDALAKIIRGVYQQTQAQQLCFDVGRSAYPKYAKKVSAYKIMGVGACLFRVLDEFCTSGGWDKHRTISEAEGYIAGYTKTWITAPHDYFQRLTAGSKDALKGFLAPHEVEPWTVDNINSNKFIRTQSPENEWVLRNMTGGDSLELALTAANINQQAQYVFNHELYNDWWQSTSLEKHSSIELRNRMTSRERILKLKDPVSFRYIADSRLRLYATDTTSPQAGKTRSYFWTPCDANGKEIETQMLDNTGSGFQIMSCIALDEVSAKYSNLLPNEGEPLDIYVRISQEALKILPESNPVLKLNLESRGHETLKKISKTASMAMLYGGGITHYSKELIEYLEEELPHLTKEQRHEIESAFDEALKTLFPHLRAAYEWMLSALIVATKNCERLTITTGIDHQFRTKKRKRIQEKIEVKNMGGFIGQLGGRVRYTAEEVDARATARSYLAGVIQGMDACLLGLTVKNFVSIGKHRGYSTFISTTHDSYRIASGDSYWLSECNRQSLLSIFEEVDVLERLYIELSEQLGTVQIPRPPQRGKLDLGQVARADHILTLEDMEPPQYTAAEVYEMIGF